MTAPSGSVLVAALYKFTTFEDCAALREPLLAVCRAGGVKGTLLLAREGINGTIAGPPEGIAAVLDHIRGLPGCADLDVKESLAPDMPFYRLKVRLKQEIVTMGVDGVDPVNEAGTYVPPEAWNDLISAPDVVVIDTRNDYEVEIGTFEGALNPETDTFREFPQWFRRFARQYEGKSEKPRIAMFCTGGIRCEKATAFVKAEGFDEVYHLKGGILKYLETIPEHESRWHGECFVFDQRVSVAHGLVPGEHGLCYACRRPVSAEDRASAKFEEGVSCPKCYAERTDEQRARYRERWRQELEARASGRRHVGASPEDWTDFPSVDEAAD